MKTLINRFKDLVGIIDQEKKVEPISQEISSTSVAEVSDLFADELTQNIRLAFGALNPSDFGGSSAISANFDSIFRVIAGAMNNDTFYTQDAFKLLNTVLLSNNEAVTALKERTDALASMKLISTSDKERVIKLVEKLKASGFIKSLMEESILADIVGARLIKINYVFDQELDMIIPSSFVTYDNFRIAAQVRPDGSYRHVFQPASSKFVTDLNKFIAEETVYPSVMFIKTKCKDEPIFRLGSGAALLKSYAFATKLSALNLNLNARNGQNTVVTSYREENSTKDTVKGAIAVSASAVAGGIAAAPDSMDVKVVTPGAGVDLKSPESNEIRYSSQIYDLILGIDSSAGGNYKSNEILQQKVKQKSESDAVSFSAILSEVFKKIGAINALNGMPVPELQDSVKFKISNKKDLTSVVELIKSAPAESLDIDKVNSLLIDQGLEPIYKSAEALKSSSNTAADAKLLREILGSAEAQGRSTDEV